MQFHIAVAAVTLLFVVGLIRLRFCGDVSLPGKPGPPKISRATNVSEALAESEIGYAGLLEADAERYEIDKVSISQMSNVLERKRTTNRRRMKAGNSMEAAGLRLKLRVARSLGPTARLLVLEIENQSNAYLAYQIKSRPSVGWTVCKRREILRHNAMALAPKETVRRSICGYERKRAPKLIVSSIETVALNELSYRYVSSLNPRAMGHDDSSRGHSSSDDRLCTLAHSTTVTAAIDAGTLSWYDVIDFYARHNCHNYLLPVSYRAFSRANHHKLPYSN